MNIFTSVLATEAGNLALTVIATGGIYLGGGILPRILPLLQRESFMGTFRYEGRLSGLMERIPVRVIMNTKAGSLGAARGAAQRSPQLRYGDANTRRTRRPRCSRRRRALGQS